MFDCRHRAPLLVVILSSGACLPDEGPLFDPVAPAMPAASELTPPVAAAPPVDDMPTAAGAIAAAEPASMPHLDAAPVTSPPALPAGGFADAPVTSAPNVASPQRICDEPGVFVCDTFEGQASGQFPSGGSWLPELSGCGTHRVDASGPAFSGVQALRAEQGAYPECMLHADLGTEDDVYVQTHVFLGSSETLLGQYLSLLELGVSATRDDPELRVGLRSGEEGPCSGMPGIDLTGSGLVGGTVTECSGIPLEPQRWYCLDVHVVRTGQDASVSVSLDGSPVLARDLSGNSAWALPGSFLKLGSAAYGSSGEGALWQDDVIASTQPIPCD